MARETNNGKEHKRGVYLCILQTRGGFAVVVGGSGDGGVAHGVRILVLGCSTLKCRPRHLHHPERPSVDDASFRAVVSKVDKTPDDPHLHGSSSWQQQSYELRSMWVAVFIR